MNRIDRLFHILLILQRKKLVRAIDLADEFSVSKRTIYRDLAALGEMGVPLIPMPGEGYSLVEGFYMPPLSFTSQEAQALFLGARMLAAQASGTLSKTAENAVEKIAHVLPNQSKASVQQIVDIIHFYLPREKFDLDQLYLLELQQAIKQHHAVKLVYHSQSHHETTERIIEPYHLTYGNGAWYVEGYCQVREDIRSFRLERIESLQLLPEVFVARQISMRPPDLIEVQVRFQQDVVRWVHERQHYAYTGDETTCENGDVLMGYHVKRLDELRSWLLGWGAKAEVLSPFQLREEIRQEAQKLLKMLT